MKLTQRIIDTGLPLPEDRDKTDVIYFDDKLPGFGIRFQSERASWVIQYRIGRQQRRMTLAPVAKVGFEAARAKAKTLLGQVAMAQAGLGDDPQQQRIKGKAKADVTLGGVVEAYLEAKSGLRPNSVRMNERYLRRLWKPLHKLAVAEISRADIAARIRKLATDHGAVSASRARATLSAAFSWAMREGYPIEQNPVIYTNSPEAPPARDRVLSKEELAEIWKAGGQDSYGKIVRLLICTGTRRQEVGSMSWSEIKDGVWTIPGTRTKNKRQHSIPILGLAEEIIASVPQMADRDLLFGLGPRGFRRWHSASLNERINEARQKAGIEPMPYWTLHDIRRTVATRMADIGIEPHIIEACLNHQSGHRAGVAGIYNRSRYEAGIRAAFERWDAELRSILGDERKVVPLRHAAAMQ
jgi:integrase